jgi:hypothetical protein
LLIISDLALRIPQDFSNSFGYSLQKKLRTASKEHENKEKNDVSSRQKTELQEKMIRRSKVMRSLLYKQDGQREFSRKKRHLGVVDIMKKILTIILSTLLLMACSCCGGGDKRSYFLAKGEQCTEQLISELSEVQTLQDLFEKQEELTILFDRIAQLSIEARVYQLKTKSTWGATDEAEVRNQELKKQLLRVLKIPGTRAFLEKCQASAFEKLYVFESRNS